MIGGILFFALTYFFARHYYSMWSYGEVGVIGFLFYLFINGGAIGGSILGFRGKRIGYYICLSGGISFPILWSYFYGSPYYFLYSFFEGFIDAFYISLPMLLLFIGGITSFIEWRMELKKNDLIF